MPDTHRFTDPTGDRTARFSRHRREGISYPSNAAATLAGCGVETASTAATAASLKKQQLEQGKKTMQQAQKKIDGAMQTMQQRSESADK